MSADGRTRVRADQALVERGLADTRSRAQSLLLAGRVFSGERRIDKCGERLPADAPLEVREGARFVSRGGDKLEGALEGFGFEVRGLTAADLGASTGGFTDCLLSRGATRVYAVDVGYGQLADKLRRDSRVVSLERTNARYLTREALGELVDLVVVDASFIGIEKLLSGISAVLRPGGHLLALVKPQFEAGRSEVSRGKGVIRDEAVRLSAVARARDAIEAAGFAIDGELDSTVPGPKGNLERFVLARRMGD
jgi:23S rRNA (cytidine1920-2'-O)/16S rRNA (cytidine1409-2'-O)-methyltransferase